MREAGGLMRVACEIESMMQGPAGASDDDELYFARR